eukprot:CAMPEP_0118672920 /NCGR_PEP_ID=MMETSP0800-20121206/35_1 /TAXON_ID=210618 ORGANISM="Striatella unipunctata, Strain CCMP2910" /NCGR_SAMPLE_ID=MMETSP0800 /ASSEMBLY_ACC=CAM_ASM_000638 /LENGTH=82 /DNA_ID=CAMNT_0006567927 /DNA_START=309 /DNA_END=557 /DNA_ORIENTATION=+
MEKSKLKELVILGLDHICFEVVEQQAKSALQNQTLTFYGEELIYNMAYKIMLIMFHLSNTFSECRFLGRSVTQTFVKPTRSV